MKTYILRMVVWSLAISAVAANACADEVLPTKDAPGKLQITGRCLDGMDCVDRIICDLMVKWKIPGSAVGIVKDGRLVHARGYGRSDVERNEPVAPDALFRIASISKPITGVMILRLVEEKKLCLDDPVLKYLGDLKPLTGGKPLAGPLDPRFEKITIRHCLHHTAGFDRGKSFDPMFKPKPLAKLVEGPAEPESIIRFMLGRRLDFSPGEKYAYSNFGYCMLGRVIERVSGMPYEEAVQKMVLKPAGAHRTRLGKTRLRDRAEGEVRYYDHGKAKLSPSQFLDVKDKVARPYGSFYLEAMDSHGAWISSTVDLLRFATTVCGDRQPALLKEDTLRNLVEDRTDCTGKNKNFYGLGWAVTFAGDGKVNLHHSGSLPGTATILVRAHNGLAWAALFNSRPSDSKKYARELDSTMWKAVGAVKSWPGGDLFNEY